MSRRKSVATHLENGTYKPGRHGPLPGEVAPLPAVAPAKPKSLDAEAAKVWAELVKLVGDRLRPEDGPQIEQCAFWLSTWRKIVAELADALAGTISYSRLVSAASVASKNFDRIGKKFGLSPLDRDSLNLPPTDPKGGTTW